MVTVAMMDPMIRCWLKSYQTLRKKYEVHFAALLPALDINAVFAACDAEAQALGNFGGMQAQGFKKALVQASYNCQKRDELHRSWLPAKTSAMAYTSQAIKLVEDMARSPVSCCTAIPLKAAQKALQKLMDRTDRVCDQTFTALSKANIDFAQLERKIENDKGLLEEYQEEFQQEFADALRVHEDYGRWLEGNVLCAFARTQARA